MKEINYIDLFNRSLQKKEVLDFINNFSTKDKCTTKGLYILGPPGCGKTEFVKNCIPDNDFDLIKYDANDVRTKSAIPEIIGNKISNLNVLDMFSKKKKKIVIVMDEMDYMNCGDKGGIKELIKVVRAKKTKKQYLEPQSNSPIIFIGTNDNDKKLKELINICKIVRLYKPKKEEMLSYIENTMPLVSETKDKLQLLDYANGNLHKLKYYQRFHDSNNIKNMNLVLKCLSNKYNHQTYTKNIIRDLYTSYVSIKNYNSVIKETDRTTLGLLWHENLESLFNLKKDISIYKEILNNLCISDYNDRIIFQNQIWQLSEQNSLIKIFYNNYLLHSNKKNIKVPDEIIFTKVLTKYSTEYNNSCFFQNLSQKMLMDRDDILRMFNKKTNQELIDMYFITELDIERMNRFIKNSTITFH